MSSKNMLQHHKGMHQVKLTSSKYDIHASKVNNKLQGIIL